MWYVTVYMIAHLDQVICLVNLFYKKISCCLQLVGHAHPVSYQQKCTTYMYMYRLQCGSHFVTT